MPIHLTFRLLLEGWLSLSLAFGLSLGPECAPSSQPEILRSEDRIRTHPYTLGQPGTGEFPVWDGRLEILDEPLDPQEMDGA